MRLLIPAAIFAGALLIVLIAAHRWRRGAREYHEADRLALARSVTSLPRQPAATDRE